MLPGAVLCAAVVVALQLMSAARLGFGLDGADQMQTVVWSGVALAGISPEAGLMLIAGQSLLSYWISGVAKLAGSDWRRGLAPGKIASTLGHGSRRAAYLLEKASQPVAIATIVFEVVGPFAIFAGLAGGLAFAVCAVMFHLTVAITMGLNNFVWAFSAALPAVAWLSSLWPWSAV
jgi:hypothetical protein